MRAVVRELTPLEAAVLERLQRGLPLVERPYAALAAELGTCETQVLFAIRRLQAKGVLKRIGAVVHHWALGWRTSAMVVWSVDPEAVDELGARFARHPGVHLAYRRRTRPEWPFQLYTMIHGRRREEVLAVVKTLRAWAGPAVREHRVLWTRKRYTQRGGRYARGGGHVAARG